jgi:hypothetical protein
MLGFGGFAAAGAGAFGAAGGGTRREADYKNSTSLCETLTFYSYTNMRSFFFLLQLLTNNSSANVKQMPHCDK